MPTLISQQTRKYSRNTTMQLFRSGFEAVAQVHALMDADAIQR